MRTFSGRILLRMPNKIHRSLAEEAFDSVRSINQLCLEALRARQALKQYDPWKSIEKYWMSMPAVNSDPIDRDIAKALQDVRRARKH